MVRGQAPEEEEEVTDAPRFKIGDRVQDARPKFPERYGTVENTSEPPDGQRWRYYVRWDVIRRGPEIVVGDDYVVPWMDEEELEPMHGLVQLAEIEPEKWYVYVLYSESSGRSYVGVTKDTKRRLREHNGDAPGGAKATRAGRPWTLRRVLGPYSNQGDAQRVEHQLKKQRGYEARMEWTPSC